VVVTFARSHSRMPSPGEPIGAQAPRWSASYETGTFVVDRASGPSTKRSRPQAVSQRWRREWAGACLFLGRSESLFGVAARPANGRAPCKSRRDRRTAERSAPGHDPVMSVS